MKIFISGISGTGMGPLALMAREAGFMVCGSDLTAGAVLGELERAGIEVNIGPQDGGFLRQKVQAGAVDWFVYTSALPADHSELKLARQLGLRISKRDELIAFLVEKLGLKLVAIAGTHGKTTTTAMIIWVCHQLKLPISYLVGTTLPFAESGKYAKNSRFLVYEADEYDRNFLHFFPWLAVITEISFDHPDIYPTPADYAQAFARFKGQADEVIEAKTDRKSSRFSLAGELRRFDADLAARALTRMADEADWRVTLDEIITTLSQFPGAGRRFEQIAKGVYSDYAHHPEEIAATLKMARETAENQNFAGVVAVYEPHQNTRQHEILFGYRDAFLAADRVFWLPTYLTRENPKLKILSPAELIAQLSNSEIAEPAKLGAELAKKLWELRVQNYLILLMTAGPADQWLRETFHD